MLILLLYIYIIYAINTDSKYRLAKTPEKCLQESERGNKEMYLEACIQQRRHLSPFFASVVGILVVEAGTTLKRLASRLTKKWQQTYSKMCRYVESRIAITLVRATHQCIRGSRVTSHKISVQLLQWDNGAGLNLFR